MRDQLPIYTQIFFADKSFKALVLDPASTTAEVVGKLKEQLGLPDNLVGYSIFEVYDGLERNMLPWEKLGDALFKWAKYVIPFFSSCQFQGTLSRGRWLDCTAHTVDA